MRSFRVLLDIAHHPNKLNTHVHTRTCSVKKRVSTLRVALVLPQKFPACVENMHVCVRGGVSGVCIGYLSCIFFKKLIQH